MARRIGVKFRVFEIVEDRVEVRNLGNEAFRVGVAKVAHEPATRHGAVDLKASREDRILNRKARAAILRAHRLVDPGAQVAKQV